MISRRVALKQLVLVSAGAALVPSCINSRTKPSALFKNMSVTVDQEALLASVCDTIIPHTAIPGTHVPAPHLFTAKMIDDCLSQPDQTRWLKGMNDFVEWDKSRGEKSFAESSAPEREKVLSELSNNKELAEGIKYFYQTVRRYTVWGYTTSEYYMTNVQNYKMIPGVYQGCVPVNSAA